MARLTRASKGGLTYEYMRKQTLFRLLELNSIYSSVMEEENKAMQKEMKRK